MSTPLEVLSYDGYVFADHDWYAGQSMDGSRGQYGVNQNVTGRAGNTSVVAPGAISPRRIPVDITLEPNSTLELLAAMDELIGSLDPRNQNARTLVANRNGVTVQCQARIDPAGSFSASGALNVVRVVFVSSELEWTAQTATTVTQSGSVSPFSAAVANAGQAVVHPTYRIGWSVQRSVFGAVVGQKYRKRMTLTNDQSKTLPKFPYLVNLGDTAALTTAKAQADGDDLRVIINGEDMTRKLIGWDLVGSRAWFVISGMDASEVLTIDVVYGNASATNPPVWTDPDPDKPIIDMDSETGTATSGNATTLTNSGASWEVNEWQGARIYLLTGGNAGEYNYVQSNTATVLTFTTSVSPNHAAGDTYLLEKSTNQIWTYAVRQTNRETDYARGRWYLDSPKYTPNVVSFESPGSWRPELILDNRDSMGGKRFSMMDDGAGAGDLDPFAIIDIQRMWEGNDGHVYNPGTADGAALTTPLPITTLYWQYLIDNPNAMVKAWAGVRGSGAEDWAEIFSDDAVTSGLATRGAGGGSTTLLSGIQTDFGDVYQIAMALLPVNDIDIDLTWRRDTGSLTSATTTTSTDSSKEWAVDQYDNGSILMTSGVNAGIKRSITSGTATVQTHAAFPAASADGDRYVVQNKRLKGRLLDGATLVVHMDTTAMTDSGLGTETEVYELSCTLWVGAGPAGDPAGQHRALIGYAAGSKRLFITADEVLEINAETRRIRVYDTVALAYTATLTDPMVIVQWHNGTEWVRSADWLPLGMNVNSLTNPTALTDTTGWTHSFTHASVTAAFARDAAVYHDAAGSFKFTISANTAGGPDVTILGAYSDKIACAVGDTVSAYGWVRTTHANLDPAFGIDWYTSADAYISSSSSADIALAADTWASLGVSGIAPATAAKYSMVLVVRSDANQTGTVYFDDLHANGGEGLVWISETNMGTLDLEVEYSPAYLGA